MITEKNLIDHIDDNDIKESFEPYFSEFLGSKKIKERMKNFLRTGGIEPHKSDNPHFIAFQVYLRRMGQEAKAKNQFAKDNKLAKFEDLSNYDPQMMQDYIDNQVSMYDAEENFEGFDEFDAELNEYEGFVPLLAAGALAKKVAPKLLGKLKEAGKKLASKIIPKLQKSQEKEIALNQAQIENKKADLLAGGADLNKVNKITDALNKSVAELKAQNKNNTMIAGNALIQEQQKSTLTVLDKLQEVLDTYKKGETEKEKQRALPWIIGISAVVVLLIIVLHKVLK